MNKILWLIFIPTLIFGGILTIVGFIFEAQHFYWIQNFEMVYLFSTLLLAFASFRIWQTRTTFKQVKELKVLFYLLAIIFAADVTNTSIYLFEGHGVFLENSQLAPAGAALLASMLLLLLAVVSLQRQIKLSKVKA
ncbi:hypothetical protein [Lactococcus allomyrinae]|uniref:Uncharacterized protein n=1 Tax=Lactococcus allomyrinae TaxID=2419773 RepID=A0A387BI74_9LACT|nr:hypothetical protein [Lactococcus allomyrinae]AYG00816.1 hypothetical protein D7I46_06730 [Lactococcus allomyrinae]